MRHTDVLGGVVGGFLPHAPFLGWRVYEVADTYEDPVGVELPAIKFRKLSGPPTDTITQVQHRTASLFAPHVWPYGAGVLDGSYPDLRWTFMDPSTLALVASGLLPIGNVGLNQLSEDTKNKTPITEHIVRWFEYTLPTGPYIGVLTAREPSDTFPLFVSGPPVEIVADIFTRKGEAYDAATVTSVRTAMNEKLHHLMPVTSADTTPQEQIDALSEAYGFTTRASVTTGEAQFVYWREKLGDISALPVIDNNSVRDDGGPTFDLSEQSRINRVRVNGQAISKWTPGTVYRPVFEPRKFLGIPVSGGKVRWIPVPGGAIFDPDKPASGLVIQSVEVVFDYSTDGVTPDADLYGVQEATIELGGMPAIDNNYAGGASPMDLQQWGEGVARLIFDKHARGGVILAAPVLRDTDGDTFGLLGEAMAVNLDHAVNAQLGQSPTSQRGGLRPYRVIERTPQPTVGPVLTMVDEGTGVQYGTAPTLEVRGSSVFTIGNVQYDVYVGNAATFAADRAQIEFQVLAFAPGETPTAANPGIRYTVLDSTLWADDPQRVYLGDFPDNHNVYFRARAWLFGGAASDWSDWTGIGGIIGPPTASLSNLVITNITDEGAQLDWSYDESPQVGNVKVQYRDVTTVVGAYGDAPGSPFAPGTETMTFTGLTSGHIYQVRVILDNAGEYGAELNGYFTTTGGKISGLSVSSITADGAKLLWTNTDASRAVSVEYRVTGTTLWQVYGGTSLPPTSNRIRLVGLQPSTAYDVQIQLFSGGFPAGDGAGGAALTDSFTTLAVSVQLEFPLISSAFEAWDPATSQTYPGRYGVRLQANPNNYAVTHDIIVLLAVETSVGSATPGTFVEQPPIPALAGVDLWFIADAPNDGKLRYMKALSRAVGYTDSIETIVMEADPWPDTGPVPPVGGGIPNTYTVSATALGTGAHSTGFFTLPDGAELFQVDSPLSKDIRIRLYTNSTVQTSDQSRPVTDPAWPVGLLFDATVVAADSYSIALPPPQRVRIYSSQHENQVVWYTLTNLEPGAEDVSARLYYFASPAGGVAGGTLA